VKQAHCSRQRHRVLPTLCAILVLAAVLVGPSSVLAPHEARAAQVSPPISPLPHSDQPAQAAAVRNPLLDGTGSSTDLWYALATLTAIVGVAALAIWREP
jgi:hypothetical protein